MKWMKAANRAPDTIRLRTGHVEKVLRDLRLTDTPWAVTTEQLVAYLASQAWEPNTLRSYRASLRTFYGWARDSGRTDVSPAHLLPPVQIPRSKPRPAPEGAYAFGLTGAPPDMQIALLLGGDCGLRRGEIARAQREGLERDLLGYSLRVIAKGGHVRLVPLEDDLADLILAQPAGWLFPSPRRPGQPMTAATLGRHISSRLPGTFTTHSLRHRAGTVALEENGGDLRAVQELLGHAKPETTAMYTYVSDSRIRETMRGAAARRRRECSHEGGGS